MTYRCKGKLTYFGISWIIGKVDVWWKKKEMASAADRLIKIWTIESVAHATRCIL